MAKKKYRVKDGCHHGAQRQYRAGDIVSMTDEEVEGVLDKFDLVGKDETGKAAKEDGDPKQPKWLELITEEYDLDDLQEICLIPDKELKAIKGIGGGTIKDIRKVYPYSEGE